MLEKEDLEHNRQLVSAGIEKMRNGFGTQARAGKGEEDPETRCVAELTAAVQLALVGFELRDTTKVEAAIAAWKRILEQYEPLLPDRHSSAAYVRQQVRLIEAMSA